MINPGRLRRRVTIEGPTARTADGEGGYTQTFGTVARVWAEIEPLQGREQLEAMQTQAGATHRVRMWYRSDITPDMRILHRGREFSIVAPPISPDEKREMLEMLVMENVNPVVSDEA